MHSIVVSCKSGYHIKDLRDKIFDIASQVKESIGKYRAHSEIIMYSFLSRCNMHVDIVNTILYVVVKQ